MAGDGNLFSDFIEVAPDARERHIKTIVENFFEKYKLKGLGLSFQVCNDDELDDPQVIGIPAEKKIYILFNCDSPVAKKTHRAHITSLSQKIVSAVIRPLILSTLDPRDQRNFLASVCATRRSNDPDMQQAWERVDMSAPADATTLGKAKLFIRSVDAGRAQLCDALYDKGGVWQRAIRRTPPLLSMAEIKCFIADRDARIQTFGASYPATPDRATKLTNAKTFSLKRNAPQSLYYHPARWLTLQDFPETARSVIENVAGADMKKLPQVIDGSYEGTVRNCGEYLVQQAAAGLVFHRTKDVEDSLPQGINTEQPFAISYANGRMTVKPIGQELLLNPAKKPAPQRCMVAPCCSIG